MWTTDNAPTGAPVVHMEEEIKTLFTIAATCEGVAAWCHSCHHHPIRLFTLLLSAQIRERVSKMVVGIARVAQKRDIQTEMFRVGAPEHHRALLIEPTSVLSQNLKH